MNRLSTFKFGFTETVTQLDDGITPLDDEDGNFILLGLDLYIDEQLINCYTDIVAFLYPPNIITESYNPYDKHRFTSCKGKKMMTYSDFYPFTCSCGIAGCASIWDGIYVKERKHTIEWRIPENAGYKFLDKSFYSFNKQQYQDEIERLKETLKQRTDRFISDWESVGTLVKRLEL